jgi:hypothetical protein
MQGDKFIISRAEAIKRLTNRWQDQVDKFPRMREDVPLELYIRRNIRAVRVFGGLEKYARA